MLNQAIKYDKSNVVSEMPTTDINGEYYGTYSGSDSGTFNIRLNSTTGVISGLLQSGNYNINLIISGNFSPDGVVQMSGKGSAGQATFTGHINVKTKEMSGSWGFPELGMGVFKGRHE